jgi:hypothetical protein
MLASSQDRSCAESSIGINMPSMSSESASWFHATATTSSSRRGLPSVGWEVTSTALGQPVSYLSYSLRKSRAHQANVTTELADQVFGALTHDAERGRPRSCNDSRAAALTRRLMPPALRSLGYFSAWMGRAAPRGDCERRKVEARPKFPTLRRDPVNGRLLDTERWAAAPWPLSVRRRIAGVHVVSFERESEPRRHR